MQYFSHVIRKPNPSLPDQTKPLAGMGCHLSMRYHLSPNHLINGNKRKASWDLHTLKGVKDIPFLFLIAMAF